MRLVAVFALAGFCAGCSMPMGSWERLSGMTAPTKNSVLPASARSDEDIRKEQNEMAKPTTVALRQ